MKLLLCEDKMRKSETLSDDLINFMAFVQKAIFEDNLKNFESPSNLKIENIN